MIPNIFHIALDTVLKPINPTIKATQNDINSTKIIATITQNKEPFNLSNVTARVVCMRPSNKFTTKLAEIKEDRIEFTLEKNDISEGGECEGVVVLYDGTDTRISTMRFNYFVEGDLTLEGAESGVEPMPDNVIELIDQLQMDMKKIKPSVTGIEGQVLTLQADGTTSWQDGAVEIDLTGYRLKSEKIEEMDLSLLVQNKLNKEYDDSFIKNKLEIFENLLSSKRDSNIPIGELDLSLELIEKINREIKNYDDTELRNKVSSLEIDMTTKRDKGTKIGELDLTLELLNKINEGTPYDDTLIRKDLSDLSLLVSKKRDKDIAIQETDLSLAVQHKLNKIEIPYDDTELRARVDNLEVTKRGKDVAIGELDLTEEVKVKLNKELTPYNDTELRNLVAGKRDKSIKITSLDLEDSINLKLNNIVPPYDDTLLRNRVVAVESALPTKRDKSVKITELDLSPEVVSKLNVVTEGYDDTEVRALISNLQMSKRDKSDKVLENELSLELQTKINQVGLEGKSAYDVAVENGFVGTKAEWLLTLKGPKGDTGPKGDNGPQGIRGIQGPEGKVGPAGIVEDENTSSGIRQVKIWTGTQLEYDTLTTKRDDTLYFVR